MKVTKGLLVRLDARHGKEPDVEAFLDSARPLVQSEPGTTAWFAVRFGRGEYGIVDVFPDDAARTAHLQGAVAAALGDRGDELFGSPPAIERFDVLAEKLGPAAGASIAKGLLITFNPKTGKEDDLAEFLRSAQPIVEKEPETTAWFAIRLDSGPYGIFDVFPDNGARFKHLAGHVPRELVKHGFGLLGSFPDTELPHVLASKLSD